MAEEEVSLESSVAIGDDVVSRDLEGEAVILNLESGTYFGLNSVGTRIWSLLQEQASLRRTFELLQQEYDVEPERLKADILRLVEELRSNELLRVAPPEEG
jgi:Coenzyme PQQ synthesis protein D (PqqD)